MKKLAATLSFFSILMLSLPALAQKIDFSSYHLDEYSPGDTVIMRVNTTSDGQQEVAGYWLSGKPFNIEGIVITSTRTPQLVSESPILTRVITSDDIKKSGAANIESVLERELAGVEFHQAGYGSTVSFQGLDARYVLFLIDGERLAGETYGNIDYSRIPLNNIDRIEIVRGASSVLYGSNAMGAIVNIITKMPTERVEVSGSWRIGTDYQDNGDELLGSNASEKELNKYRKKIDRNNIVADLYLGLNLGKFRSSTSLSFRSSDAYKMRGRKNEKRHYDEMSIMTMGMPVTTPPSFVVASTVSDTTISSELDKRGLGVSGYENFNINQKFDYRLNDKFRFELSGGYYNKKRYDFHTSMMDDNPMSGYIVSDNPWTNEVYEDFNGKFLMEHSPNQYHKVYLSYMRDEYHRDLDSVGSIRHKQRHVYNIPRLLWTWNTTGVHMLTTGLEYTNEVLQFDLNASSDGSSYSAFDKKRRLHTVSLYVQDEINRHKDLSLVLGVRGDWNDKFGWRATPQLSAKYRIDANFTLRENLSFGYRNPSLKEMYMVLDLPIPNVPKIVGNPDLKAETNIYFSSSITFEKGRFYASAAYGQSHFRNKIDARWEEDASGNRIMRYTNVDRSMLGNIDISTKINLARGLYFSANYNYTFDYEKDNAESSTQYIYPSPHTLTASLDYSFIAAKDLIVRLNTNARYVSGKDYEDFMPYINMPQEAIDFITGNGPFPGIAVMRQIKYFTGSYTAHQKGYAICNALVSVDCKNASVTLGVDNIFDYRPKVVSFNSAITPRTSGYIKLGFNF